MREIAIAIATVVIVAALQPLLVHFGHPQAVWLWCTMLGAC
jgi:hypothetical protein